MAATPRFGEGKEDSKNLVSLRSPFIPCHHFLIGFIYFSSRYVGKMIMDMLPTQPNPAGSPLAGTADLRPLPTDDIPSILPMPVSDPPEIQLHAVDASFTCYFVFLS
jgi:hypothetical protein